MPPRKRFNAFEDFNNKPTSPTPEKVRPPAELPTEVEPAQVERIERLPPSQMRPDRFQPRRLLPSAIRIPYFSAQIGPYQAAARWLELAAQDPAVQAELDGLMAMGASFDEHGQIKAITGSWQMGADGTYFFQIETGERRFWAACLNRVRLGLPDEPLLRVEVISRPTRQRQVLENRHAEPPTAVEQACEVAALILAELGQAPDPGVEDEYDYFRRARQQRMPPGLWEKLTPIMQLTRPRMVQLLNILQLPSHLLELADQQRLPERVLREVLARPQAEWEAALRAAAAHQLTSEQTAGLDTAALGSGQQARRPRRAPGEPADPVTLALRALRRFEDVLDRLDEENRMRALDELADVLVVTRTAEEVMNLLDELHQLVQARLQRM